MTGGLFGDLTVDSITINCNHEKFNSNLITYFTYELKEFLESVGRAVRYDREPVGRRKDVLRLLQQRFLAKLEWATKSYGYKLRFQRENKEAMSECESELKYFGMTESTNMVSNKHSSRCISKNLGS